MQTLALLRRRLQRVKETERERKKKKKRKLAPLLGCWFPHSECRVVLVRLRLPPAAADSHTPYIISYNPHCLSHREVTNPLMYQVFSPTNYHRRQCSSVLIAYGKWAYTVRREDGDGGGRWQLRHLAWAPYNVFINTRVSRSVFSLFHGSPFEVFALNIYRSLSLSSFARCHSLFGGRGDGGTETEERDARWSQRL